MAEANRVTVLDLMAQASASTPASGAAAAEGASRSSDRRRCPTRLRTRASRSGWSGYRPSWRRWPTLVRGRWPRSSWAPCSSCTARASSVLLELMGEDQAKRLADDPMVGGLLLIHGLYPVPLEERVLEALDGVRPYMESHGGNVEFLGIEEGVAKLRLEGSCRGCAASAATLELAIKKALMESRAGPARHGRGGRRRRCRPTGRPTSAAPRCRWRRTGRPLRSPSWPGWLELDDVGGLPEGRLTAIDAAGLGRAGGQRERHAAGLPRRLRSVRRRL